MRTFYEAWNMIECNSAVTTAELIETSDNEGDTIRQLQLTNLVNFPIVAFLSISFSHHSVILTKAKEWDERLFHIQFAADNKVTVDDLEGVIKKDLFHHHLVDKIPKRRCSWSCVCVSGFGFASIG